MQCPSVITFVNSVKTNKHTIPVFPYQTSWWNSNGDPADIGIEGRWGRQKSRFWANIWLHRVLSMLQPARCYQHGATRLWQVVTLIAGSKRRSLLLVGYDDEMFMTRSVNVMPKTTEQHLMVRSDKSIAYANVTNNKRLCSTFSSIEANYWQTEASCGLFATAELASCWIPSVIVSSYVCHCIKVQLYCLQFAKTKQLLINCCWDLCHLPLFRVLIFFVHRVVSAVHECGIFLCGRTVLQTVETSLLLCSAFETHLLLQCL